MQTTEEQEEIEHKKRKKKLPILETGNSSFNDITTDTESYNEIKESYEKINEEREYTNRLVERKADELADRIRKEHPSIDDGQLTEMFRKISEEILSHYPAEKVYNKVIRKMEVIKDEYKNLRDYISKILGGYKGGMYVRKYNKESYQDLNLREHPYADCSSTTERAFGLADEIENIDKNLLEGNSVGPLIDKLDLLKTKLKDHAKRNNLPLYEPEDWSDPTRKPEPISLKVPPSPKDEVIQKELDEMNNEFIGLLNDLEEVRQSSIEYCPDDPEIIRNLKNGIKSFRRLFERYSDNRARSDISQWVEILGKYFNIAIWRLIKHADTDSLAREVKKQDKIYNFNEMYEEHGIEIKTHDNGLHPLTDMQDYVDPKTGKIQHFKLTNERIKETDILDTMAFICEHFPFFLMLSLYFRSKKHGYKEDKKRDLHGILGNA